MLNTNYKDTYVWVSKDKDYWFNFVDKLIDNEKHNYSYNFSICFHKYVFTDNGYIGG